MCRIHQLHVNNNETIITTVSVKTYSALFIEKVKNAKFILNESDTRLVVMKVNERPRDLLTYVLILLQFEHVLQHTHKDSRHDSVKLLSILKIVCFSKSVTYQSVCWHYAVPQWHLFHMMWTYFDILLSQPVIKSIIGTHEKFFTFQRDDPLWYKYSVHYTVINRKTYDIYTILVTYASVPLSSAL